MFDATPAHFFGGMWGVLATHTLPCLSKRVHFCSMIDFIKKKKHPLKKQSTIIKAYQKQKKSIWSQELVIMKFDL